MTDVEKLAVFDLDGTLWDKNSHYEILNAYFKTKFYYSLLFRLFRHFFKNVAYKHICKKYEKIPKSYVLNFELPFNDKCIELLKTKKKDGFVCIIVTNAPYEIAFHAAERLKIPFIKAEISQKKAYLDSQYSYKELFVCTDNIEDIDLIYAANSYKIMYTKANRKFFETHGIKDK